MKGQNHESQGIQDGDDLTGDMKNAVMMGHMSLPEDQVELDNMTDSNTRTIFKCSAHIPSGYNPVAHLNKQRRKRVSLAEHNQVVNLADIDAQVGKFKNQISDWSAAQ